MSDMSCYIMSKQLKKEFYMSKKREEAIIFIKAIYAHLDRKEIPEGDLNLQRFMSIVLGWDDNEIEAYLDSPPTAEEFFDLCEESVPEDVLAQIFSDMSDTLFDWQCADIEGYFAGDEELLQQVTHRYGKIFPLAKLSPDERECKLRGTLEFAVNGKWHPLTSFCGRKLEILEEWSRECIEYIRENNLTEE